MAFLKKPVTCPGGVMGNLGGPKATTRMIVGVIITIESLGQRGKLRANKVDPMDYP